MNIRTTNLIAVLGLVTICLTPAFGNTPGEIERAFTPTKSLDRISGTVIAPDGVEFNFVVRDGQWLRLENVDSGETVAYLPKILEDGETLRVEEFVIEELKGGERVSFTGETLRMNLEESLLMPRSGYQITFERIERRGMIDDGDPSLSDFQKTYGTRGSCCITCGGTTSCGCAVEASCGSCCSDPCCPGGGDGRPHIDNRAAGSNCGG